MFKVLRKKNKGCGKTLKSFHGPTKDFKVEILESEAGDFLNFLRKAPVSGYNVIGLNSRMGTVFRQEA